MERTELKKKLSAASALLDGSSTTLDKVASVIKLLKGVHPSIDFRIAELEGHMSTLQKLENGSVIELAVEKMPEATEDDKKRKKVLLLFLRSWNDLKSEIARVSLELDSGKQQGQPSQSTFWRIFSAAKGPLGLITVIALGLAALSATSVSITIHNQGCGTLEAKTGIPISIPGLSLPSEPIPSGGSAVAVVPPLTLTVEGTGGNITMKSYGLNLSFNLDGGVDQVISMDSRLSEKRQKSIFQKRNSMS